MDKRLLECIINNEHNVMGRKLLPFAFWHVANLERIESPLLVGGSQPTLVDLELASRICASSITSPMTEINPPAFSAPEKAAFFAGLLNFNLDEEIARFHTYHRDYVCLPRQFDSTTGGKRLRSCWEMLAIGRLMYYGHMSRNEAWMFPIGEALHLIPAFLEIAGFEINVMNDEYVESLKEAGYTEEEITAMEAAQRGG